MGALFLKCIAATNTGQFKVIKVAAVGIGVLDLLWWFKGLEDADVGIHSVVFLLLLFSCILIWLVSCQPFLLSASPFGPYMADDCRMRGCQCSWGARFSVVMLFS